MKKVLILGAAAIVTLAACGDGGSKAASTTQAPTTQAPTTTAPAPTTTTVAPTTTTALPGAFTQTDFQGKCNNLQANFTAKIAGSDAVQMTFVVTYKNGGVALPTQGRSVPLVTHPAKVNHVVVITPQDVKTFDACSLGVEGMTKVPDVPTTVSRDTKVAITKCIDGSLDYGIDMAEQTALGADSAKTDAIEAECDDAYEQAKVDAPVVAQVIAIGQARMAHLKVDALVGTHGDSAAQAAPDLDAWTAQVKEMVGLS